MKSAESQNISGYKVSLRNCGSLNLCVRHESQCPSYGMPKKMLFLFSWRQLQVEPESHKPFSHGWNILGEDIHGVHKAGEGLLISTLSWLSLSHPYLPRTCLIFAPEVPHPRGYAR